MLLEQPGAPSARPCCATLCSQQREQQHLCARLALVSHPCQPASSRAPRTYHHRPALSATTTMRAPPLPQPTPQIHRSTQSSGPILPNQTPILAPFLPTSHPPTTIHHASKPPHPFMCPSTRRSVSPRAACASGCCPSARSCACRCGNGQLPRACPQAAACCPPAWAMGACVRDALMHVLIST